MKIRTCLSAPLMLCLLLSHTAAADDSAPNAALSYWPGSHYLPRYSQLSEAEQKVFADPVTAPLDDAAKELVKKSALAINYVHQGAQTVRCDWGLNPEAGPLMLIPHMDYIRPIQRVMIVRARLLIADDQDAPGVNVIVDSIVLARHLATDGTPVGHMVRCALEAQAIEVLAAHLGELDPDALSQLERRLDQLPAVESAAERIERERDMFIGWVRAGLEESGPEGVKRRLAELIRGNFQSADEALARQFTQQLDEAIAKGADHLTVLLKESKADYGNFVALMNARPDQIDEAQAQLEEATAEGNVISRILLGSVINPPLLRTVELEAEARMAMLKAAIEIAQHGPSAVAMSRDPLGDGPFQYEATSTGFTLTSSLHLDRELFMMSFAAVPKK